MTQIPPGDRATFYLKNQLEIARRNSGLLPTNFIATPSRFSNTFFKLFFWSSHSWMQSGVDF
jgi:hypothetical protein